ncbi:MAG: family 20 glycosylhydrolase [Bacteroidaceae bacterium]|nr:family 20 glycosylhydrolase [Bacteroidaceae bacterium]
MKKNILLLILSLLTVGIISVRGQKPKPFVIPEIKEWCGALGDFTITDNTRIIDASEGAWVQAKALQEDWQELLGQKLTRAQGKPQAGDIVLKIVPKKKANPESYTISIGDKVELTAPTATGLYWATRTLLQMAERPNGQCSMVNGQRSTVSLPKGIINDYPDFEVRGFMIDCGRKYIPISYLQELVKIMAYYKMNTLQVHLNDNGFCKYYDNDWQKTYAAFRLECETYPGLTARDGYYTKQEFRRLQQQGLSCGVEIIPEIDAPAHSLAFTHYRPELGSKRFGVDHLDITNPQTIPFLDSLWREYLVDEGEGLVFIGPRVHIGTDEYNNSDPAVVEQFRLLADHLIKFVESYGKQACLWGSLTHAQGTTPVKSDNVIMSLWYNGYAKPDSMLNLGYKGISIPDGLTYIVPNAGYYFDYLNIRHLYNHWTPNQVGNHGPTFPYDDHRIMGGMFAVWNDICGNGISVKDIHHRVYPALQTLSAKFWTGRDVSVPFNEFDSLRLTLSEAPGVNELGKLPDTPITVATVQPNQELFCKDKDFDIVEAGYNYSVSFHLKAVKESKGTILFSSPNATFYLADPVTGRLGYERDGYLYSFDFAPYPGEEVDITIEGDNRETRLYVNGNLAERKNGRTYWTDGKKRVTTVETLVFPLQSTGNFRSTITQLVVRKL